MGVPATPSFETIRTELAVERCRLRDAERDLEFLTAVVDRDATEAAGGSKGLGTNADERERALILARQRNEQWVELAAEVECARDRIESLQAQLDIHRDARAERRLALLERLIDLAERDGRVDMLGVLGSGVA